MIPERAVEAAFEGGWKFRKVGREFDSVRRHSGTEEGIFCFDYGETFYFAEWSDFAFDPAFWRAVGKAKGWPSDDPTEPIPPGMLLGEWKLKRPWGRAMRFYDLAYNEGDLAAYWDEILPRI